MSKIYRTWAALVDPVTNQMRDLSNIGSGQKGLPGDAGSPGQKGEPGTDGAVGQKGETGASGSDGAVGQKGETGSSPLTGFKVITASFDASSGNSFNWSTNGISALGVSNVVREDVGVFKISFETALASNNYTAVASAGGGNHTSSGRSVSIDERTTESCTIRVERTDTGSQQDESYIALIILGA